VKTSVERFGVSVEPELLQKFDALTAARGYASRSEAIRDLIRQALVTEEWTDPAAEVIGTVTIVYDHHAHELAHVLAELQHQHHDCILCATHIHMDAHHCMEVIIVRGDSARVTEIAHTLISTRGVMHGKLVSSTTAQQL
jgi:CopG family nickel-responsive transcriptional regulator